MPLLITALAKKLKENACKYFWKLAPNSVDDFYLVICLDNGARVWKDPAGRPWRMRVKADGKVFSGERETLEDAFKATDRLVYKHFPHVWTSTNCRVILDLWAGDLSTIENSESMADYPPESMDVLKDMPEPRPDPKGFVPDDRDICPKCGEPINDDMGHMCPP